MGMTLKEAQEQHRKDIEANQGLGVVEYDSTEPLSDRVFEVVEGKKFLPGKGAERVVIGPGNRFHPTEREIKQFRGKPGRHSLEGKARELTGTEYTGLKASPLKVAGADIGIRALPITGHVLKLALDHNVTEGELRAIAPAGPGGNYTKAQVEEIVSKRAN
jgi:hypothetical protein